MGELTALPDRFSAGTTVVYRRSLADFPASSGCTLALYLAGPASAHFDGVADGDDFVVTLAADKTDDLPAGIYRWEERAAIAGGTPERVAGGVVTVEPDLATASGATLQDPDEIELAAVRARISEITTSGIQSYGLDGAQVMAPELRSLHAREAELRRRLARKRGAPVLTPIPMRISRLGGH